MTAAATHTTQSPSRVVERDGVRFTILGTAHVSRASAEEVRAEVAGGRYDAVAVELCQGRLQALTDPDFWARMDLFQILRTGRGGMLAAHLALSAYQQRLAEQLGVEPGAEMKAAVVTGREAGLDIHCIDRDVGVTLKRVYRGMPWWQRFGLVSGLMASLFSRERVTESDVEALKRSDMLESTFSEFAQQAPGLFERLVTERDRYMAARLMELIRPRGPREVLVVVGAGHVQGLADRLEAQPGPDPAAERTVLDQVPPGSRWVRWLPWIIAVLVIAGFIIGFRRSPELGLALMSDWVLINGGLSALGAAAAAAHPITVAGAFLAAPLTSLNPMVGAGLVAGLIEVVVRRPRGADFQNLRGDVARLSGWWRNRVARTLLVFLFAGLGSAAGTYLAGFRILDRLV